MLYMFYINYFERYRLYLGEEFCCKYCYVYDLLYMERLLWGMVGGFIENGEFCVDK